MSLRSAHRPLRQASRYLRSSTLFRTTLCSSTQSFSTSHDVHQQAAAAQATSPEPTPQQSSRRQYTPPYPTIATCPSPSCPCAATPSMPEGLPIDYTSKMSMPYYDRHVVLSCPSPSRQSSQDHVSPSDTTHYALAWPSKVEDEPGTVAGILKGRLGPKGPDYRPDFSVSVTASTLPAPVGDSAEGAFLFPDFEYMSINAANPASGQRTSAVAEDARSGQGTIDTFSAAVSRPWPVRWQDGTQEAATGLRRQPIRGPVVLICGHGQRDMRCGILGPLLQEEFQRQLAAAGYRNANATRGEEERERRVGETQRHAYLGLVSHIGGHKFAGNVVIYMPPRHDQAAQYAGQSTADGTRARELPEELRLSPLAGQGIWYGRVEPKHVEGIVRETILGGKVIQELLRGVHDFGGTIYRQNWVANVDANA